MKESIHSINAPKTSKNLYNDENYSFLSYYKEVLWEELSMSNILWEWMNAVVLRHPIEWTVIKIRKPWMQVDDIGNEIQNHEKVLKIIMIWKWKWKISHKIKIPEIIQNDTSYLKTYFIMEKIQWQTLSSKIFRNEHHRLKTESPELLNSLTDRQIIEHMINKYWSSTEFLKSLRESNTDKYLKNGINKKWSPLYTALQYLKQNGIEHTDLHSGNIMIDKKCNIYIIDFWTMKNT
jgi:serine/threonine protein kinase